MPESGLYKGVLHKESAEALLQRFADAWNRGDIDGACAVYAPGAIMVTKDGVKMGGPNILRHYSDLFLSLKDAGDLVIRLDSFHVSPTYESEPRSAGAIIRSTVGESPASLSTMIFERFKDRVWITGETEF